MVENAKLLGIISDVNGSQYIQLWTANDEVGKSVAARKREEDNKQLYAPPSPPRPPNNSVVMDIVKDEFGITISSDFQKKAWSNKSLNEKVVALFSAAEEVAAEAEKLFPKTE